MKTLIKNARIVNEKRVMQGAVLIDGDKIAKIFQEKERTGNYDKEIDAKGQYLLPGVIDDQVHFRQPGMTHKADIYSESRAAAAGGVTSYMEMPNTHPATINMERIHEKQEIAAADSLVNYAFYMGATPDNLSEIEQADPETVAGLKVFMGSSTGNLLVNKAADLERIFKASHLRILTHSESDELIAANLNRLKNTYGDDIPIRYHPVIRSEEACYRSSAYAVELAAKTGARLHVLHLSTAREMDLFEPGPVAAKKITAEACVHHLWFCDEDYDSLGTKIKWNPAIKTARDREALREALRTNRIDVVATDHAPHLPEEKAQVYTKAPSGGPLVQHSLPMMLELTRDKLLDITDVVEKMAHNPARLFGIRKRGFIREGYFADMVLVSPDEPWTVSGHNVLYKCGWSPIEGQNLHFRVVKSFVNGQVVFENGRVNNVQAARPLKFDA